MQQTDNIQVCPVNDGLLLFYFRHWVNNKTNYSLKIKANRLLAYIFKKMQFFLNNVASFEVDLGGT